MRTIKSLALAILVVTTACGDDGNPSNPPPPDAAEPDAPMQPPATAWKQVEHLARPGINEALLISEGFLGGYNATAPSFTGVPAATLNQVVGEAKTVLKALYLGSCLLNGALGLSPANGVKPAGITCHVTGPAIWAEGTLAGVTLTAASMTAAQAYADKVFGQFEPDVMRIDTSAPSGYLTLCGNADSTPLLCGGRNLQDDVIDVTYNYLINGAGTTKAAYNQFNALTSDGVNFSDVDANNAYNVITPVPNPQQYHPNVTQTWPFSAAAL